MTRIKSKPYLIVYKIAIASIILGFLGNCSSSKNAKKESRTPLLEGAWKMEMNLNGKILPVDLLITRIDSNYGIQLKNNSEIIDLVDVKIKNDSLLVNFPVFESRFQLIILDSATLGGVWKNDYKGPDYEIPVMVRHGESTRFPLTQQNMEVNNVFPKYSVTFSPFEESSYSSIGLFSQKGSELTGTFATETGDYRHLEGVVDGDSIKLSTFDGSHAFLFLAKIVNDSLKGMFYSGTHFKEPWLAKQDEKAQLRNPDSLTFLNSGYESVFFNYENEKGEQVSLFDQRYDKKVVIIQILGSWCPNCLDETNYLSQLYRDYKDKGLEIVGLDFERTKSKEKAIQNLKNLKKKTGAQYELLLAGSTREESAEKALPMLNHIMSYPTTIFLDKNKKVRKIHTGFYGPGTGKYYTEFTKKTELFLNQLLAE